MPIELFDVWVDCHLGDGDCYQCGEYPVKCRIVICDEVDKAHADLVSRLWSVYRPEIVPTGEASKVRR